eukprot:TRINITY_DN56387_c0_g1_i3.p1 TRINITY_DN56387_c0_g1~~TRINITY_DN56387_c0_g1_i3.p1  ORF type:complete len:173 (-),score=3.11 TRINITY_DN56387_c0_g1_i3:69-587(-)
MVFTQDNDAVRWLMHEISCHSAMVMKVLEMGIETPPSNSKPVEWLNPTESPSFSDGKRHGDHAINNPTLTHLHHNGAYQWMEYPNQWVESLKQQSNCASLRPTHVSSEPETPIVTTPPTVVPHQPLSAQSQRSRSQSRIKGISIGTQTMGADCVATSATEADCEPLALMLKD